MLGGWSSSASQMSVLIRWFNFLMFWKEQTMRFCTGHKNFTLGKTGLGPWAEGQSS